MTAIQHGPSLPSAPAHPVKRVPKIVWGGSGQTLTRFPHFWELDARCNNRGDQGFADPIQPFLDAVGRSAKRIWILDPHFDEAGVIALQLGLVGAPRARGLQVRIIGPSMGMDRAGRCRLVTDHLSGTALPSVDWVIVPGRRESPFVHDRFCIVDEELFHFGGTVGGSVPHLTAATFGWCASTHEADRFFSRLWEKLQT